MRNKKAKKLRAQARLEFVGQPECTYDVSWHGRKSINPLTNEEQAYQVPLIRLSPTCVRHRYQQLKAGA